MVEGSASEKGGTLVVPAELRRLLAEATPGPWEVGRDDFGTFIGAAHLADAHYGTTQPRAHHIGVAYEQTDENFALIVYLRNNVEALLDEAREQGRREERAAWLLGEKRRVEVE